MLRKGIFALVLAQSVPVLAAKQGKTARISEQYQQVPLQGSINISLKDAKRHIATELIIKNLSLSLIPACYIFSVLQAQREGDEAI
ncbi:hypothetical protein [Citrobacter sp. NCU1]|uniref:hypothetical protein n=1 Tax=Citrobacter sp. NCU1 TaxID=2026683 RepID=UPI001390F418|nr:hypothetical protein [Citrobacter sp. NCU1]